MKRLDIKMIPNIMIQFIPLLNNRIKTNLMLKYLKNIMEFNQKTVMFLTKIKSMQIVNQNAQFSDIIDKLF